MSKQLSNELIQEIVDAGEPFLGLATTKQLIEELKSRGEVSQTMGETWYSNAQNHGPLSTLDTTEQLINELYYRAHVSKQMGATWPDYKTVDGGFSINVDVQEE